MKKLNLNAPNLQRSEVLTRSQLKKVLGGNGSEGGSDSGPKGDLCVIKYTAPNGYYGTTDLATQTRPGSGEANSWCVNYLSSNPTHSCRYDCASDGFGS